MTTTSTRSSTRWTRGSAAAALTLALAFAGAARAETWVIDAAHSKATFKVRHLMISNVDGSFGKMEGKIEGDPAKPDAAVATATIDAASISTGDAKRDEHLRGADFFDVAKFPTITFKGKKVQNWKDQSFDVVGDLTMHGVTKEVTLNVTGLTPEIKDPWGNTKRGMTATTKLNRKDFGIEWNKALDSGGVTVGNEVSVTIELEIQKKA